MNPLQPILSVFLIKGHQSKVELRDDYSKLLIACKESKYDVQFLCALAYIKKSVKLGSLTDEDFEQTEGGLYFPLLDPMALDQYIEWIKSVIPPARLVERLDMIQDAFRAIGVPKNAKAVSQLQFETVCKEANELFQACGGSPHSFAEGLFEILKDLDAAGHYDPYLSTKLFIALASTLCALIDDRFYEVMNWVQFKPVQNLYIIDYARTAMSEALCFDVSDNILYWYFAAVVAATKSDLEEGMIREAIDNFMIGSVESFAIEDQITKDLFLGLWRNALGMHCFVRGKDTKETEVFRVFNEHCHHYGVDPETVSGTMPPLTFRLDPNYFLAIEET